MDDERYAQEGNLTLLQQHIDNGGDVHAWNANGHTPLYLACEAGNTDCVKVLLKNGAKLNYRADDKTTKFSCLNAAIDKSRSEVIILILSQPREEWMDAFRFCGIRHQNGDEMTPLRKLIKKMPEMAKLVFDKLCTRKSVRDKYLYTEVIYNYEFLEDYQDIYSDFQEISTERLPQPEQHSDIYGGTESEEDITPPQWGPEHYKYRTHPLYLMVHYKRKELLAHELVTSFLCMRWNTFLKYIYYTNLLTYIVLMLLLTIYMHIYLMYAQTFADFTNRTLSNCSGLDDYENITLGTPFPMLKVTLITSAAVIVSICLFRTVTELVQIVANPREYFSDFLNYAELFLYFSTISFVCNGDFSCLNSWRWQLGALCIFLSWLNFVFFLRLQPKFGIYVIMFEEIISTFLKVLPLALLLIFAFGQPFFILLGPITTETDPQTRPFSRLHYSLIKTLTMMIGEFETDSIFYSVPSILLFPLTTFSLWIIFVLVMPILMQNLLVGLAVDNIKEIRKQAEFKRQVAQVKVLLTLMSSRPFRKVLSCCMKIHFKGNPRQYTKTVGRLHPFGVTSAKHRISSLVNFAWKPQEMPTQNKKSEAKVLEKLEAISQEIRSLRDSMKVVNNN